MIKNKGDSVEIIGPNPEWMAILKEILAQNRIILEAISRPAYKVTSLGGKCIPISDK